MQAGKLRHLIEIQEAKKTQNEYGEPVRDWQTILRAYASREDISGRTYFAAQQAQSEVTTRFRIRWIEGIKPSMRIKDNGTLYQIESVQDPEGRQRELVIMARRQGQ